MTCDLEGSSNVVSTCDCGLTLCYGLTLLAELLQNVEMLLISHNYTRPAECVC